MTDSSGHTGRLEAALDGKRQSRRRVHAAGDEADGGAGVSLDGHGGAD